MTPALGPDGEAPPSAPAASPSAHPGPAAGLSAEEVRARVAEGRVNRAPAPTRRTLRQILRANVLTRFNAILGGLLVVVAIIGPVQDGLFGVVLVVNTAIGIGPGGPGPDEPRPARHPDGPAGPRVRDGERVDLAA